MPRRKRKHNQPYEAGDLPTPEQLAHGGYERGFLTHAETNTKAMAWVSRQDPIKRWESDRKLTDQQIATIEQMQTLWAAVYGNPKTTASYSEPVTAPTGNSGSEAASLRQIALRDELRGIEALFQGLEPYYMVFERICRWGMHPLQVARSREGALETVKFVADLIHAKRG